MPNRWKVLFIFATEIQNRVDTSSEDLRVRLDKRRHHVDVSDVNRNDDKRHDDARHSMAASKGERHRASAPLPSSSSSRHDVRPDSPPVKIIKLDEKKKDILVSPIIKNITKESDDKSRFLMLSGYLSLAKFD